MSRAASGRANGRAAAGLISPAAAPTAPPALAARVLAWAALALAIVGIGMASYLAIENLQGKASGICVGSHGCASVQQSEYGKILGTPVSVPGLALYLALALAAGAWLLNWRGLRDQVAVLGFYGALFGTLFSGFLTYLEGWVIDAWCTWCIASAVLMTVLLVLWLGVFLIALRARRRSDGGPKGVR